jgi:hypothetical protein
MAKALGLVCCASLLMFQAIVVTARQAPAADSPVTLTATIEAIDKETRTVTLKRPTGTSVQIKAPDQMEGFYSLRVGDQVTATYYEMVVINLRKPGDPNTSTPPVTTTQRKDRTPGSETRRQRTVNGTIEAIDEKTRAVTMKTSEGTLLMLPTVDAKQLTGLKAGDTIAATYYESLFIKVARAK